MTGLFLADAVMFPVALLIGIVAAVVFVFLPVWLLEAFLLLIVKWGGVWTSLKASLLMNVLSALMGLVMYAVITVLDWNFWHGDAPVSGWVGFIVAWALSVLIEAWALRLLRRLPWRELFAYSLMCNIASYALIYLVLQSMGA